MILVSKYPTDTESDFQKQNQNWNQILKKKSNPRTNTQMFYLCVDLKTGTEIYTCLWKKWLEPGVNSDPIYQTRLE
jgi:hypothetical protein